MPTFAENVWSGFWYSPPTPRSFPIDCPDCILFDDNNKNQCQMYKSNPKKVDTELIKQYIEEIKNEFLPQFKMSLDHQMCLMQLESGFIMNAANCDSTARGLGQVIKGTGQEVLEQGACANINKEGLDWSKSARSSKFQVLMSMCALLSKSHGGPIDKAAIKKYYGSEKDSENESYYSTINTCAHKGAWSLGN